jgi:hypothetical protein
MSVTGWAENTQTKLVNGKMETLTVFAQVKAKSLTVSHKLLLFNFTYLLRANKQLDFNPWRET